MDGEQVTGPSANLLSWAMDQARAVPYHLFIESVINATVKGAASQRDRRGGGKYRALLERLGEHPSFRKASCESFSPLAFGRKCCQTLD